MKKRILSFGIVIIMLLSMIPCVSANDSNYYNGIYGYLDYSVTIGYYGTEVWINSCSKQASGDIIIPDIIDGYRVAWICEQAFEDCDYITSITIPDTVHYIGEKAFYDCDSLESVKLPEMEPDDLYGYTNLGEWAFSYCSSLKSIIIPKGIGTVSRGAFDNCPSLESVIICDGITAIDWSAFWSCDSLKNVEIPESVTSIGQAAFGYCSSLESIKIPENVTKIENNSFKDCTSLTSIYLPESIKTIEFFAFANCNSLTDVWYDGTEQQKNEMEIDCDNEALINATWHYSDTNQNHIYDDDCDEYCNICGEYRQASHVFWEYVSDNNATIDSDGTKTRICLFCNKEETIPDIGSKLPLSNPDVAIKDSSKIFTDIDANAWYKDYVDYAVTHYIFKGTYRYKFSPNMNMTRAQFVQVFANISGVDTSKNNVNSGFSDVKSGEWYTSAIKWAAENGIVSGVGNGKFDPNAPVTREQMCVMIVNYVENYQNNSLIYKVNQKRFIDHDYISSWAKDATYKCQRAELISGTGNGYFDPTATATRAVGATIFSDFHKKYI